MNEQVFHKYKDFTVHLNKEVMLTQNVTILHFLNNWLTTQIIAAK